MPGRISIEAHEAGRSACRPAPSISTWSTADLGNGEEYVIRSGPEIPGSSSAAR